MTLQAFTGTGAGDVVFDSTIIWDGQQNRFFYAADWIVSASDNRIAFGWSKTATPSSAADFCKYGTSFGATFPDYPKLGDSKDYMLVGVNDYAGETYLLRTCWRSPSRSRLHLPQWRVAELVAQRRPHGRSGHDRDVHARPASRPIPPPKAGS